MAEIVVGDQYVEWVDIHVGELFRRERIEITREAILLIAFSMQAQVYSHIIPTDEMLFKRAAAIVGRPLVDYYKDRYGEKEIDFNRALSLLGAWGMLFCFYPFRPTRPR